LAATIRVVRVIERATKASERGTAWVSLIGSCALLLAIVAPGSIVTAAVLERTFSWQAVSVAVAAGGVCYFAAALSLVATFVGNRYGYPVQGLLLGMALRMGLPLVALIGFGNRGTLGATLVVVYLLALIADTILALRMMPPGSRAKRNGETDLTNSKPRPSVAS
jgi:hypothetical protein